MYECDGCAYTRDLNWPVSIFATGVKTDQPYCYINDLSVLDSRKPREMVKRLPEQLSEINTTLVPAEWEKLLSSHPDAGFREYLVRGMSEGFRLGSKHDTHTCKSAKSNVLSATKNALVVEEYLTKEIRLRKVVGPLDPAQHPKVHISRFSVIPKNHQPGK